MAPIPNWVPNEVIDYLSQTMGIDKEQILSGNHDARWLLEDETMETAWKAIGRRSDSVPPEEALKIMLRYNINDYFFRVLQEDQSCSERQLVEDIERALSKYKESNASTYTPEPVRELQSALERIKTLVQNNDDTWAEFGKYVNQRNAPDAVRVYLTRAIAVEFFALYGTPLYASVAAIVGVILDDKPLDTDHVRKLVKPYLKD